MEAHTIKVYSQKSEVPLKIIHGHFVTSHSHVNYYIDMTTLKARQNEAEEMARSLARQYLTSVPVDTIICFDGTQVIGAFLAEQLSRAGNLSYNAHKTIYVVTPETHSTGQMVFRDNIQPMIRGKHVLILMASVTTGITVRKSMECVQYYGGMVSGISAIFSAADEVEGMPVNHVFGRADLPDYETYAPHDCPFCRDGQRIDALVNSYGYSRL